MLSVVSVEFVLIHNVVLVATQEMTYLVIDTFH